MKRALIIVLACITLPAMLVTVDAARRYMANRTNGTLVSSGQERQYILHVPKGHDAAKPAALVISLHPAMSWTSFQMNVSQWNRVADAHDFLVVYPAGEGGGPKMWNMRGIRTPSRMRDVVFISELIDKLSAQYAIDPARIYANGFSNGGGMSFALSCTLPHRIAAIGAVGAAQTVPWDWCRDTHAVPMIAFHGTGDRFTPYLGGKVFLAPDPFPSIPEWTAKWARRNRCSPSFVETSVAFDLTRREYTGCANDASVILYTVKDGGHTWPGGTHLSEWMLGRTTDSLDASEAMWAFFSAHPMKEARK